MKISEVAELTGLSVSTIRFYEKSGLCPFIERGAD
ncbi:MAG: MerR family DNA-binding transcriptional regulator [Pseudomonadota bacterium]